MEINIRDNLKDMEYFNEFINEDSLRIKKFSDKLKKGEVRSDRIMPVRSKIHDLKLGILIAKYSRGDEYLVHAIRRLSGNEDKYVFKKIIIKDIRSKNKTLRI